MDQEKFGLISPVKFDYQPDTQLTMIRRKEKEKHNQDQYLLNLKRKAEEEYLKALTGKPNNIFISY